MKSSNIRIVLMSTVSTAMAVFLLPASAQAQATTCSQTGTNITCVDGAATVLTATTAGNTLTVPGQGLRTVAPAGASTIVYTATAPIATTGTGGVNLTSTAGALSFTPAAGTNAVNIATTGVGANGLTLTTPGQAATVTVGNITTNGAGSFGVLSNSGTDLVLKTGNITTTGASSRGIQAINQTGTVNITAGSLTTTDRAVSVAAGGTSNATVTVGNVSTGASGVLVNGGSVNITTGSVNTANGFGVIGQALTTGTGGVVIRTGDVTSTNGAGVGGSVFNATGSVDIGCGNVTSNSPGSAAVFAQNGGPGSLKISCGAVSNIGNNAVYAQSFAAANGSDITINVASATNSGTNFSTIFADTVGTGGITLNAGTVTGGTNAAGLGAIGIDLATDTGTIDAGYGNVTTVGTALQAVSTGTVNLRGTGATLRTSGADAPAAVINAATITGNLGNVATTGARANGGNLTATNAVNLTVGSVSTTGVNAVGLNVASGGTSALTVGSVNTAAADGVVVQSVGNSTTTVGTATIAGNNTRGVAAQSAAGNVTVAVANGAATGTGATLVSAQSGTAAVAASSTGTLSSTGAGSRVVDLNAGGNLTGSFANVTAAGVGSSAIVARSGGTQVLTISGTVSDTATGTNFAAVDAQSGGNLTVTNNGLVSTTGAGVNGINARSTGGTVTVAGTGTVTTTGAGSTGVFATTGTTGNAVSATQGAVRTTGAGSAGVLATGTGVTAVTLASGSTTGAGSRVIDATGGTVAVTTTGPITASGAANNGAREAIYANATDGAAVLNVGTVTATSQGVRAITENAATIALLNVAAGGTVSSNGDTIVTTSGSGTILNNAGTITSGNGFALSINGGAATIGNSGTITGLISLTANSDTIANSGTITFGNGSTFGAGNDTLTNSGTILVGSALDFGTGTDTVNNNGTFGLVARTAPLALTLTGLEAFNNTGTVTLQNGIVGDTLTIPGTFTGTGASRVLLDVDPSGTGLSDRLIVGGAATGSTMLGLNFVNGAAVLLPSVTLVQAGAGTSAGAFYVSPTQQTRGLITYGLTFNAANNSFNLAGAPSATAIRLLKVSEGAQSLWHETADAVSAQLATQRDAIWSGAPSNGGRVWMQVFGRSAEREQVGTYTNYGVTQQVGSDYKQDAFGIQAGVGLFGNGALTGGITGGYTNSVLKFPGVAESVEYDVLNIGLYAGYNSGSFFLNALGKYDRSRIGISAGNVGLQARTNGNTYGAKGEAGFRLGGSGFYAEPNVSLAYIRTDLDTIRPLGVTIDFDNMEGLRGSAGLRIGSTMGIGGNSVAVFYAGGDYVHEFQGEQGFTFSSGSNALAFRNVPLEDYGRGKLGMSITSGIVTGFIEGNGIYSKNYSGGGGRAGLRIAF